MIIQEQLLISWFNNLNVNPQVQYMVSTVNYVISPFEGNINPRDPQGLKLYPLDKKGDESDKFF